MGGSPLPRAALACAAAACNSARAPAAAASTRTLPPPLPLPAATKVTILGVYVEDPPNIGVAVQVVLASGAEADGAAFGRKLRWARVCGGPAGPRGTAGPAVLLESQQRHELPLRCPQERWVVASGLPGQGVWQRALGVCDGDDLPGADWPLVSPAWRAASPFIQAHTYPLTYRRAVQSHEDGSDFRAGLRPALFFTSNFRNVSLAAVPPGLLQEYRRKIEAALPGDSINLSPAAPTASRPTLGSTPCPQLLSGCETVADILEEHVPTPRQYSRQVLVNVRVANAPEDALRRLGVLIKVRRWRRYLDSFTSCWPALRIADRSPT